MAWYVIGYMVRCGMEAWLYASPQREMRPKSKPSLNLHRVDTRRCRGSILLTVVYMLAIININVPSSAGISLGQGDLQ